MQQFAPRALEPDIANYSAGRLAEKTPELALQCSPPTSPIFGQIGQTPIVPHIRPHRVEPRRTPRGSRGAVEAPWEHAIIRSLREYRP